MTSETSTANVAPGSANDNSTISVSVRIDRRLAKLVRQAAAKQDTTRSGFMAAVAIREAREVMELRREEDFQAWLAEAA